MTPGSEPSGAGQPPAEVIIGVDVGTTAAKVGAFGLRSSWRTSVAREYPLLHPKPGWEVQDPAVISAAVRSALADVVYECGEAAVVAISLSSAMHGLIGLDRDEKPITPLLTWADSRAAEQAARLRREGMALELLHRSGTPVHSMSPFAKLMWFNERDPDTAKKVKTWVGLKDFGIHDLTGTMATELSCASGTGLLDLRTGTWSPDTLTIAGISEDQLPPVLPTTAALGLSKSVAGVVGLPATTPVVLGAGDGPIGNLGTGALQPGVVGLSLGTSGALRMVVPEPAADPAGMLFCYALTPQHWVVGAPISNGGATMRWMGDLFGKDLRRAPSGHPDVELLALAESVPIGSDGLVMLPYLMAERAPLWDPLIPGAFLGVRNRHTRGHFVRAALEGVAVQLSLILDRLNEVEPVTSVRATGGVFRGDLWRRVLAAVLGKPLTVTGGAEGSALGACALALYGLGRADSLEAALSLLGADGTGDETLQPDQTDIDAYSDTRHRVADLLDQLAPVADVFRART